MSAPVDLANPSTTPIAWNSFAHTDFLVVEGGDDIVLGPTEPIKAGIAIPYGQVRVSKEEVDPPPGVVLPPYLVSFACTVNGTGSPPAPTSRWRAGVVPPAPRSGGRPMPDLGDVRRRGGSRHRPGQRPRDHRRGPTTADDPQDVVLSNTYLQGALQITKIVEGDGVGLPLEGGGEWGDGPFTVNVDCRFPATTALVARLPPDRELDAGETVTISPLPVGAACTVTEIDDGGAWEPRIRVDPVDPDARRRHLPSP